MIDSIFLGLIQGIFEWIPISSEGMVAIFSAKFLKNFNPLDFALFLHLGTFFACLIYFRNDWFKILSLKDKKLLIFLIISTVISLSVGYLIYQLIKNIILGKTLLAIVGIALIFNGFLQKKKIKLNLSFFRLALLAGFFQGLSVIPGFSRSGSTIFALSLVLNKPFEILKISYLMSAPVILASSVYFALKVPFLYSAGYPALIFSFLAGIIVLDFLMKISLRINFSKFNIIFGIICFLGIFI